MKVCLDYFGFKAIDADKFVPEFFIGQVGGGLDA
jgi:hypothetical protein